MHIDGQCHCGRITYEAEIDPERVGICHCTDCQQLTGSPYRVSVTTEVENIRRAGEEPKCYVKTGSSGAKRLQYFCGECGSPLFVTGEGEAGKVWGIRWGSIVQRAELAPQRQIWCRSATPWAMDISALPGKETI
ncbi:MAG: GFA family protein [Oricola sp.]